MNSSPMNSSPVNTRGGGSARREKEGEIESTLTSLRGQQIVR